MGSPRPELRSDLASLIEEWDSLAFPQLAPKAARQVRELLRLKPSGVQLADPIVDEDLEEEDDEEESDTIPGPVGAAGPVGPEGVA